MNSDVRRPVSADGVDRLVLVAVSEGNAVQQQLDLLGAVDAPTCYLGILD
jgi:hypothetical protein